MNYLQSELGRLHLLPLVAHFELFDCFEPFLHDEPMGVFASKARLEPQALAIVLAPMARLMSMLGEFAHETPSLSRWFVAAMHAFDDRRLKI